MAVQRFKERAKLGKPGEFQKKWSQEWNKDVPGSPFAEGTGRPLSRSMGRPMTHGGGPDGMSNGLLHAAHEAAEHRARTPSGASGVNVAWGAAGHHGHHGGFH